MVKLESSLLSSLQEELKEIGVQNICIPDPGEKKVTVSCRVGRGTVSFLFDEENVGKVEVFDPERLLQQEEDVYYVPLLEALSLILKNKKEEK